MADVAIVGTDTDAGKTSLSLLFLAAFPDQFAYWKPVETGESDTETVRRLVPGATIFEPLARYREAVAPALAASREGRAMPGVAEILKATPASAKPLLIETFGSPLSPLSDAVLQVELIRDFHSPIWLVATSAVGAIGRVLQSLTSLKSHGLSASAVILIGPPDEYAVAQIRKHWAEPLTVFQLEQPRGRTNEDLQDAVNEQRAELTELGNTLETKPETTSSIDWVARDRAVVWHPYTSLADPIAPLPVVGADEEFLHLADGRRIIDGISSWWTILHGHNNRQLKRALQTASESLDHVLFAGITHPAAIELAERLLQSTPWNGGRAFYSDNGSTAVEVALKMAYQFCCHRGEPERTLFIGFDDCYHGDTFGTMAISRDPTFFGRFEPLLFRTERVPISADALDAKLFANKGKVAGVIIEPLVLGAGGMKMYPPSELKAIEAVVRKHGVAFIVDEVMTRCRTGSLWAFSQAGVTPDFICSGKTLTGGILPLAVTLVSPRIVAEFETPDRAKTFFHGHSFTANPLACAVAVVNERLMETGDWHRQSDRIEQFWRTHLVDLKCQPGVNDVRICGTIAAIEIESRGGYLSEIGPKLRSFSIERGVLLRPLGNVLYAMPPLCTSEESLAKIVDVMRMSVRQFA